MKAVSAQTHVCDPQTEGTPDNAKEQSFSIQADLTKDLGEETKTPIDRLHAGSDEHDPSELAARILQLHAANDAALPQRTKRPELLWEDDDPLQMPVVFASDSASEWLSKDHQQTFRPSQPTRYGPSFRALLASTVLLAAAGSGAIALGLPDMVGNADTKVLEVQTTKISAVPKEDRFAGITTSQSSSSSNSANPKQIEKAKDRIRQAFVDTSPNSQNQTTDISGRTAPPETGQSTIPSSSTTADVPSLPLAPPPEALAAIPKTGSIPPAVLKEPAKATLEQTQSDTSLQDKSDGGKRPELPQQEFLKERQSAAPSKATAGKDAGPSNTGIVTASVNLRQSDQKNGKIIGTVPDGTEIQYETCGKWWCEVVYEGKTGFVGQKFVQR
ncbi:SH3 domain-containing protein [Roseibium sp.]|uniref:SH3 domain-containing protein n=1 Tax=Roseibium sp. TaxID=1936156 RepID=UPI003B51AEFA